MNRNLIFSVLAIWVYLSIARGASSPNVVLVITDDQGYGDLGCHGNPELKTPHLDQLYQESVRLKDFHVSPTCSPTRGALLTGRWTNRVGTWHTIMGRSILRANEVTIAEVFQQAGYATAMFGKWHLGDNYPYRPEDRGFEEVLRHGGGGIGQTPDFWDNAYFDGTYFHNSQPEPVEGFCTDVWFDRASRFIRQQHQKDRPFFVYLSTNAPHGPMHAPESASAPYQHLGTRVAHFFGMIANIDDNVGRLRQLLRELELEEDTLFIFMTDNGTSSGGKVFNAGMRGTKGSPYDGGHRVPVFLYWPEGKLTGGRDVEPLTAHVDIMPTLIDLCGLESPEEVRFDGRSIRPLLEEAPDTWPERILVTDSQRVKDPIKWRQSAVMTDRWRLINGKELFDIKSDPGQKTDCATDHREVVEKLRSFYEDWWSELLPTFAEDCPIYLGHEAENPAVLTCHDWITTGSTPWNQAHIRQAVSGAKSTGYWIVQVVESGEYEIRLRRWPMETGASLQDSLPAGASVPGERAFRTHPGQAIQAATATLTVGDQNHAVSLEAGDREAVFHLSLRSGKTQLGGHFEAKDGTRVGAYYAYVRKK